MKERTSSYNLIASVVGEIDLPPVVGHSELRERHQHARLGDGAAAGGVPNGQRVQTPVHGRRRQAKLHERVPCGDSRLHLHCYGNRGLHKGHVVERVDRLGQMRRLMKPPTDPSDRGIKGRLGLGHQDQGKVDFFSVRLGVDGAVESRRALWGGGEDIPGITVNQVTGTAAATADLADRPRAHRGAVIVVAWVETRQTVPCHGRSSDVLDADAQACCIIHARWVAAIEGELQHRMVHGRRPGGLVPSKLEGLDRPAVDVGHVIQLFQKGQLPPVGRGSCRRCQEPPVFR